jgi:hypothetical protein
MRLAMLIIAFGALVAIGIAALLMTPLDLSGSRPDE